MAQLVQWGIQDLGLECTRLENHLEHDAVNIIFNYHGWFESGHPLQVLKDYNCIIFQAEQLQPGGRMMPDWYFEGLKRADVWDYSPHNIEILTSNGIEAELVPPAYSPQYKAIEGVPPRSGSDVLFMGCVNSRREFLLGVLNSFCNVEPLISVWGIERDEALAAAKMLVNIHFYHAQTLELLRITHAMNSGVPVISEHSDGGLFVDGIVMVPYHELAATVVDYLSRPDDLIALGKKGQEVFRRSSMAETIGMALGITLERPSTAPDESSTPPTA